MTTTSADKAEQLLNQLHAGIETLTTSDAWTTWLDVARTFHSYSVNNTILIWTQRPDATHVAGYHAWRKETFPDLGLECGTLPLVVGVAVVGMSRYGGGSSASRPSPT